MAQKPSQEDNCQDMGELYETLDALVNRFIRTGDISEKVSIRPLYDPCVDHSPIAGYLFFERLTKSQGQQARKEMLKHARKTKRQFFSIKPRLCRGVRRRAGIYGRLYYKEDCVHATYPKNVLLNKLPENLNMVYVYFLKPKISRH